VQLLTAQPLHLLAKSYPGWPQFLRAQVDATIAALGASCPSRALYLGSTPAGADRHPLSRSLPWLASFLDMPTLELPGDHDMPRVQDGAIFGASERFAVSPGHEEQGYCTCRADRAGIRCRRITAPASRSGRLVRRWRFCPDPPSTRLP